MKIYLLRGARWCRALSARNWWIIILIIPSLYLLFTYPPLWIGIDATCQLTFKAGSINILQYPPVYCFLSRIPFSVASLIEEHKFHHHLLSKQIPSPLGIYFLIILQHMALIGSLVSAVIAAAGQNQIGRVTCAVIFASMSGLFTQAHSCGSESWGTIATIVVFTSGIMIARRPRLLAWLAYGIGVFFAIGSRHLNGLLPAWLPITILLVGLVVNWKTPNSAKCWRAAILASGIGICAIGLNSIIARTLIASVGEHYRTTIGRTLSLRIFSFLDKLSPEQRVAFAEKLAAKQNEPLVCEAIRKQAAVKDFGGTGDLIAATLRNSTHTEKEISEKTDQLLLTESLAYLTSLHPALLQSILTDVLSGFSGNMQKIALSPFWSHSWAASDSFYRPDVWKYLANYDRLNRADANAIYTRAKIDPYIGLWKHIPIWLLYLTIFVMSAVQLHRNRVAIPTVIIVWTILLTGLAMFVTNMICVFYMDRYALSLLTSITVALSLSVTTLINSQSSFLEPPDPSSPPSP